MNEDDDGLFRYDDTFVPLCVKPDDHQLPEYKQSMNGAVTTYLQESYKDGMKPENFILENGLSVGEAGVCYFRDLNCKRRKGEKVIVNAPELIRVLKESLEKNLGVNLSDTKYLIVFEKHVNVKLFQTKQYEKRILPAIKSFLAEVNLKTKGYSKKLKTIMENIKVLCANEEDDES